MATAAASNQIPTQLLNLLNGSRAGSGAASAASQTATGATSASALQNEFLTLFTTQLKNQDPLNPMDSSQMTSQLAQISTVSGIQQLDSTMQSMMSSNAALETTQAAGLIGHTVLAPGSSFQLPASGGSQLGASLQSPADHVRVTILDANKVPVKTLDLGAQSNSVVDVHWDGTNASGAPAPPGAYSVQLDASLAGKTVTATPLVQGKVTGVTHSSAGITLDVAGVGAVALGTVAQID